MVGFIACFAAKIMTYSGKNRWIYTMNVDRLEDV